MVVNDYHNQFKVLLDKVDSLNSANFSIEETDLFLSDAQEEYIEQWAYGNNNKKDYLEETQQAVKALQSITKNAQIIAFINNTDNKPNGTFVQLPSDYRHAINEEATVTTPDCNNISSDIRLPVIALSHDKYNNTVKSPFAKPNNNKVYRLPYGRITSGSPPTSHEHFEIIIAPNQVLKTYYLRYLKNPKKIDKAQILSPLGLSGTQTGELPDESYRIIIAIAVRNALGTIESQRTQESKERINELN